MNKSRLLVVSVALVASLSASGCVPNMITQGGYPESPFTLANNTIDERALLIAEASYNGIGTIIEASVDAGLLTGERAARVRELNRQAYDALVLARQAQAAADARTYVEQTTKVLGLIAQIQLTIRSQE